MAEVPTTSETIEEDATELQFPKGMDAFSNARVEIGSLLDDDQIICGHCKSLTKEPYIQCAQCQDLKEMPTIICVPCFAKGVEFSSHKNNHKYIIIKNDFSVFSSGWQAKEELRLINSVIECGFGNWVDISNRMQRKSPEECREHYLKFYVEDPHPEFPLLEEQNENIVYPQPITYKGGSDDPPRPIPGTAFFRDMAGYNAARSDFEVEFDHNAELEIQDLDLKLFEDDAKPSLGIELQMCLLDKYRRKLGERFQRKKLIRDHGLIAMSKSTYHLNRYKPYLKAAFADSLPRFYNLLDFMEMDLLLEGLKCEMELKRHIVELLEYRFNGIKKQNGIMTYETLKKRREVNMKERRNLVIAHSVGDKTVWDVVSHKNVTSFGLTIPSSSRRVSVPLNIIGMPGYDSLSDREKEIASETRLLPEDFIRFKGIFIDECRRNNGLRLAQARTLLKIDVNKIRKIYDHLMSFGFIHAPKRK
ncbi:transcriptional adapter 2-alpha-like isoform X1 [Macrobrachium rosenbergii]|uniref:transcriptional adapter 2-alpha-like isoform X1 n=1 Tax=Macrobrachium rosenbergii TaxID=79674 RepID=UPI0034D4F5D2